MEIKIDMNLISTLAGLMSIVLGVFAIWLSIYFFNQSKNAERQTATRLAEIKAQAEILKDITAKQMTRLIRHATEQRPMEDIFTLISTVKNIPDTNIQLHLQQQEIANLTAQAVEGYIGSYYYSAVTNCLLQLYLPDAKSFDSNNQLHTFVKTIIDMSYKDFNNLKALFASVSQDLIQNSPVSSYYISVEQFWSPLVKDSATCFIEREQGEDGKA